jgi:hypothetical protein
VRPYIIKETLHRREKGKAEGEKWQERKRWRVEKRREGG